MEFQFDFENNRDEDFKEYVMYQEVWQDHELEIFRTIAVEKKVTDVNSLDIDEERDNIKVVRRKAIEASENISEEQKLNSDIYKKFIILATRVRTVLEMISIENQIRIENNLEQINIDLKKQQIINLYNSTHAKLASLLNKQNANYMKDSQLAFNFIKQFDKDISSTLSEYDIENYNTKMNDALYWQSTIFDSIPLKTISKIVINGEEHIHVQIDRPIKDTMSEERRQTFQDGSYINEAWYQNMPRFKQITFEKYKGRIISGQHVIPSKFAHIPGLRNVFERTDEIYKQNIDAEGNIIGEEKIASSTILHTGNSAVIKAGNDTDRLTRENLEQLSTLCNSRKIFLFSLMNKSRLFRKEYPVVKNIERECNEMENIYYINIPLNFASILSKMRNFSGLRKYLRNIIVEIGRNLGIQEENMNLSLTKMIDFLISFGNLTDNDRKIIDQIIKVLNLANKSSPLTFFSRKNRELILNAEIHNLINMVNNNEQLKQNCFATPTIFCKSGLNRTMPQVEFSQATILSSQIAKNNSSVNPEDLQKEILQSSLKTKHSANLNGYHGGGNSVGNNGIISGIVRLFGNSIHYLKQNGHSFMKHYENNGRLHFVNVSKSRKIISLTHELSAFHATMIR